MHALANPEELTAPTGRSAPAGWSEQGPAVHDRCFNTRSASEWLHVKESGDESRLCTRRPDARRRLPSPMLLLRPKLRARASFRNGISSRPSAGGGSVGMLSSTESATSAAMLSLPPLEADESSVTASHSC